MSTSTDEAVAVAVAIDDQDLSVQMRDGRTITAPLVWFPRLAAATPAERNDWRLIGDGEGIHWPALDEDLSVAGLLRGR